MVVKILSLALLSITAFAEHGLFAPYSPTHISMGEMEPAYVHEAFEKLGKRLKTVQERIAGAQQFQEEESAKYEKIALEFYSQRNFSAYGFYTDISMKMKSLTDLLRLKKTMAEIEELRKTFLEKYAEIEKLAESTPNETLARMIGQQKLEMYLRWHKTIETYNFLNRFLSFDDRGEQSQEDFNSRISRVAFPLANSGLCLDNNSAQWFSAMANSRYVLNYSFLYASTDNTWNLTDRRNDKSHSIIGFPAEVAPYFHAFHDKEIIGKMFSNANGKPLSVRLISTPFSLLGYWTKPVYDARKHQLTMKWAPFKGDWGSTRWEPGSFDWDCAKLLREKLK